MKPDRLFFQSLSKPLFDVRIGPKAAKIILRMERILKGELKMRIATVIFAGSVAGAIALATPALARNSDAQKPADEAAPSSPCHAYEMGPDGAWRQQPCLEAGAPAQAPRKSAAHSGVGETQTR